MNSRKEGTIAILAALLVLFSAMWDPRISVALSVVLLIALGVYRFVQQETPTKAAGSFVQWAQLMGAEYGST